MFDRKILTDNFKFNTQSPKTLLPKFDKKIFSGTTLDLVPKLLKKLSIFSYFITSYHTLSPNNSLENCKDLKQFCSKSIFCLCFSIWSWFPPRKHPKINCYRKSFFLYSFCPQVIEKWKISLYFVLLGLRKWVTLNVPFIWLKLLLYT